MVLRTVAFSSMGSTLLVLFLTNKLMSLLYSSLTPLCNSHKALVYPGSRVTSLAKTQGEKDQGEVQLKQGLFCFIVVPKPLHPCHVAKNARGEHSPLQWTALQGVF